MAIGEQRHEQALHQLVLADEHLRHFGAHDIEALLHRRTQCVVCNVLDHPRPAERTIAHALTRPIASLRTSTIATPENSL